jgi:archaemetzincin
MPIGRIHDAIVDEVSSTVREHFGVETCVVEPAFSLNESFDAVRNQYNSFVLLREVSRAHPPEVVRILGMTECDLFIPMLTFVFGQAQFEGPAAIVSLARLRQEFYGLPADPETFRARLRKEVAHELGHTFGLVHCGDPQCIMSLANTVQHVDRKQNRFCGRCRPVLDRHISNLRKTYGEVTLANPGR